MSGTLKFLVALAVAFAAMFALRALAVTLYTVTGPRLAPLFAPGDRVLVNRWSYGLRTGGSGLFPYGRWWRQAARRGDLVAFDDSTGSVMIGRLTALPGDTARLGQRKVVVPGRRNCAHHDYYLLDSATLVREEQIVGRVVLVVYNHDPGATPWQGYDPSRFLLPL